MCISAVHVGLASRRCISADQWASPNVSQCQTIEQISLMMRAEELSNLVNSTFAADDRDMTVMFMPELIVEIASELDEITNTSESQRLLPNDISSSAITLDIIITYVITLSTVVYGYSCKYLCTYLQSVRQHSQVVRESTWQSKGSRFNSQLGGPLWCCCCFLEQETLITLLQSSQLLKRGPGGLVPTEEAAHPAVTSMGTWCKLGKQMLNRSCLI